MQMHNILFDTDLGDDIDDALALLYLLGRNDCELLGVTTCHGDTAGRARLVSAILTAAGRDDVPIFAGKTHSPGQAPAPDRPVAHLPALARLAHRDDFTPGRAVEFISQTVAAAPGQVTILATGPLTNIAEWAMEYPPDPTLAKDLFMMNGCFRTPYPEYNAVSDPRAAAIVYAAPWPSLTAVGLDVTGQCQIPAERLRRALGKKTGPLAATKPMADIWFADSPAAALHDPLAAATIFEPGLCEYDFVTVAPDQGLTMIDYEKQGGPHRVATDVRAERFIEHFLEIIGALAE